MEIPKNEREFFKRICWGLSKQILKSLQGEFKFPKKGEIRNKDTASFNLIADDKLVEIIIPIKHKYALRSDWNDQTKMYDTESIQIGQVGCQILSHEFQLLKNEKFDLQDPELIENIGCWVATQL